MTPSAVLEQLGITESDLFFALLASMFIADYGTVRAVSADGGSVDVAHAVQPRVGATQLGDTVTEGVQVLWLASSGLSAKGKIAVGDRVLLVGLKDLVPDVGQAMPAPTDIDFHYTRETMKAIPLGKYSGSATHTVDASGAVMVVDGGTEGVARMGDAVGDTAFWSWVTAVEAALSALGHPVTALAELTIQGGSAKVKVG